MSKARAALVTVGGLGFLRPAPGTWGSLPPVAVCLGYVAAGLPISFLNVVLLVLIAVGCAACLEFGVWAEARFGRKDAREVVADELAGQSIALLLLPWREITSAEDWYWNIALALIAFLLFRAADIIKPPPARSLQRLPGGQGILIDDLIAGVYALIATQAVVHIALEPVMSALRG
jgi:phosphatidylglycerophosphatase A